MSSWGRLKSANPAVPDITLVGEVILDKKKPPITDATTPRDKLSAPHCKFYEKDGKFYIMDMKRYEI